MDELVKACKSVSSTLGIIATRVGLTTSRKIGHVDEVEGGVGNSIYRAVEPSSVQHFNKSTRHVVHRKRDRVAHVEQLNVEEWVKDATL